MHQRVLIVSTILVISIPIMYLGSAPQEMFASMGAYVLIHLLKLPKRYAQQEQAEHYDY